MLLKKIYLKALYESKKLGKTIQEPYECIGLTKI